MFALLQHDTGADRHWDLLVEVPGCERLPTWRLSADPLRTAGDIPAARIRDHRPLYLEYEGELSEQRGVVRRVDRGPARVETLQGDEALLTLEGQALHGEFSLVRSPAGLVFRSR